MYDFFKFFSFHFILLSVYSLEVYSSQDCQRECDDGPSQRCVYDFHIEHYYTMSKACQDCPNKLDECELHHCITADGVGRGVVSINRQIPAPSIQVCQGDEIIVNVKNHLRSEGTSIHWHGLHMMGTPFMDGVPFLTQCPISSGSTFQYKFYASNPGTHYYHSHAGFQRTDGAFGSFIVRQSRLRDPHSALYDEDLPEHVLLVSDWLREMGLSKFVAHLHHGGDDIPSSIIINGKGRIAKPKNLLNSNEMIPLATFDIQKGKRYRFRIINNGILDMPVTMSIDNHTLLVIATDGNPIRPVQVDSIVMTSGERFDIVVNADRAVSSYWIRFSGLMDWNSQNVFQTAILRYKGAAITEPDEIVSYETSNPINGIVLNPLNFAPGDQDHITIAELKDIQRENHSDWQREPDHKFYLAYDFTVVDEWTIRDPEHYPIFGVEYGKGFLIPQLNHISMKMPSSPPLTQSVPPSSLCNESTVGDCTKKECACPYTLDITLGSLVEVLLIDEGKILNATHPFHLHGSSFRVVAMEKIGSEVTVEQIRKMDKNGQIKRNLIDAPLKDTVAVPDGGFTIIRFMATNPGYWFFHCHLEFHSEFGMGVIFKIGERKDFPPVPEHFPTCGSWIPTTNTYNDAVAQSLASQTLSNNITQMEKLESVGMKSTAISSKPFIHHYGWILFWCIVIITQYQE